MSLPNSCDVAVAGAGLAGLAGAVRLQDAGLDVQVLEASDGVGGRARTDRVGGFLVDRGFQVLSTAYPEARRVLDVQALDLRRFDRAMLLHVDGRAVRLADPLREPRSLLTDVRASVLRKDPECSADRLVGTPPDLPYVWPVRSPAALDKERRRAARRD